MQTQPAIVRDEASPKILWKWTGVSAILHTLLIASLCGVSYWRFHQQALISKAKAAADEVAAQKAEAAEAAKNPAPSATPSASPAVQTPTPAAVGDTKPPVQAEKVLGIDKTAKPDELPSSPFSSKNDDLLKDLK